VTLRKTKPVIPKTYESLLHSVRETLLEGQHRIEAERVRTYWETGRLIYGHVLKFADRAEYGTQIIASIASDLEVDKTLLNRCVQFAKKYPRLPIVARGQQFSWSHYRRFIAIEDDKKRLLLQKKAADNAWSAEELGERLKLKDRSTPEISRRRDAPELLLTPVRGKLHTYRIIKRPTLGVGEEAGLLVDLGFGIFLNIKNRWNEGDVVRSHPRGNSYKFLKVDATVKDLFTYVAFVERVIDGDTLKVRLDLGFKTWTRQVLRLRGIDTPEMDTKAGQDAKTFVQSYIKEATKIIVRSSRSDKYDRYLADVFIPLKIESNSATDLYLNNLLLEKGYAKLMA
jgi:endonuclease YncB( thermonuclease family)